MVMLPSNKPEMDDFQSYFSYEKIYFHLEFVQSGTNCKRHHRPAVRMNRQLRGDQCMARVKMQ